MIKVYKFTDAPGTLRRLLEHGGDGDWVVVGDATEIRNSPFGYARPPEGDRCGFLTMWGWAQWTRWRGKTVIIFAHA